MTVILRFRDLNVPLGETLSRHRRLIQERGHVWWGWIRRQREIFPKELFAKLATECKVDGPLQICLFDSGEDQVWRAQLAAISAAPGGLPLPTPETRFTPPYMAEAVLPAWFKLTEIDDKPLSAPTIAVNELPTLDKQGDQDRVLLASPTKDLSLLRYAQSTLWDALVEE